MSNKYFIKAFRIDPSNKGIVSAKTPLLPFFGDAWDSSRASYLNVGEDAVAKGTNDMREVRSNGSVMPGFDKYHAASGLGYTYGNTYKRSKDLGENKGKRPYMYIATLSSGNDEDEDADRKGLKHAIQYLLSNYGNKSVFNDSEALMLVAAPEDAIVSHSDMLYGNYDAYRDTPHEVQAKYFTPVEQIPYQDYQDENGKLDIDRLVRDWAPYEDDELEHPLVSDECLKNIVDDYSGLMKQRRITEALLPGIGG